MKKYFIVVFIHSDSVIKHIFLDVIVEHKRPSHRKETIPITAEPA